MRLFIQKRKLLITLAAIITISLIGLSAQCGIGITGQAPSIELEIYDGPDYSESDNMCYYRVEAIVTGTSDPEVTFGDDEMPELNNINPLGSGRVEVRVEAGDSYTLTATAKNSAGTASTSIILDGECGEEVAEAEEEEEAEEEPEEEEGEEEEISGQKIIFVSDRDGNLEIYVMNADGSGQTRLTNNPAVENKPDWSPDGSKIAFSTDRDGNTEIYVMNADGTGQTNLTNNPIDDIHPDWSPDGSKIVFESNRDGGWLEIYVMNADGTGQTRLTDNQDQDVMPNWSPDGSKIVFSSLRDKNYEIYVMNADGTGQTRLTDNQVLYDIDPDW